MLVEAYSPIAHGELFKNRQVADLADRYGVSIAQLSIRYVLQLGLLPLPKTANPDHMRSNADIDFELSDDDMQLLGNVAEIEDYGESSSFPVFIGRDATTAQRVWFITGSSRGMGAELAKAAPAAGHAVVATGRRPDAVTNAIGTGDDLLVVELDVTDPWRLRLPRRQLTNASGGSTCW
jgi:Aldo/keto reductase family